MIAAGRGQQADGQHGVEFFDSHKHCKQVMILVEDILGGGIQDRW